MSSKRFAQLVASAYQNNDLNSARDAYYEWQQSHCLHPFRQRIYDSHSQVERTILLPCGKCYHCMESKINEWVTRMYAHAEDFKNVYFVTLTYRSISDPKLAVNRLLLNKLSQAVWHQDNYNFNKHLSFSPCLLVKKHYQDFLKRLRKNTGIDDLSYVLSGEYGSKYGRPHFHLVLFTNKTLSKSDVVRAWSVCLWRDNQNHWSYRRNQVHNGSAFDFPIGSVDFHDLVSNGTFNTTAKIKVDGTFLNAANCFSYVCKYVVKRDKPNLNRVRLAYNNLFKKGKFVKVFDNEVQYSIVREWLIQNGYSFDDASRLFNNHLKQLSYEKILYSPSERIFADCLQLVRKYQKFNIDFTEELLPSYYFDFKHKFSPFCEFSRGCPIGSVYASRNLSQFKEGVFTRPLLQDAGFVVPSYFRSKARNSLYGLRKIHRTISGNSFVFGPLQKLLGRFENASAANYFNGFAKTRQINIPNSCKSLPILPEYVDISTGERIYLINGFAHHFKFDRHDRRYHVTQVVPVHDWIRFWCASLKQEFERYKFDQLVTKQNLNFADRATCMITDLGVDTVALSNSYEEKQRLYMKDRQLQYLFSHKSAE